MTIETVIEALLEVKSLNVVPLCALPEHDLVDDVIVATAQNSVHLRAVVETTQGSWKNRRYVSLVRKA